MLDHFSEQSWVSLRDELLDHSPRQFFGKSSFKFVSQPFSLFFSFLCHALTPIVLGCPGSYGMHDANSKQFMLIYLHIYINKINSHTNHIIHVIQFTINNTEISSHGLITIQVIHFESPKTYKNHTTIHVNSVTLRSALFTAIQVGIFFTRFKDFETENAVILASTNPYPLKWPVAKE